MYRTKVDFLEKAIECLDESRERRMLQGKSKPTSMRLITIMQGKTSHRKGYILLTVKIDSTTKINNSAEGDGLDILMKHPILNQFQDVFIE